MNWCQRRAEPNTRGNVLMSNENLKSARNAFAAFEESMGDDAAIQHLEEALGHVQVVFKDRNSTTNDKSVVRNFVNSHRINLIREIKQIISESGTFDPDFYVHWGDLVSCFEEYGFDDDEELRKLKVELFHHACS